MNDTSWLEDFRALRSLFKTPQGRLRPWFTIFLFMVGAWLLIVLIPSPDTTGVTPSPTVSASGEATPSPSVSPEPLPPLSDVLASALPLDLTSVTLPGCAQGFTGDASKVSSLLVENRIYESFKEAGSDVASSWSDTGFTLRSNLGTATLSEGSLEICLF